MHANLSFFQIISGDGWSTLSRPIIEKHPITALVFVGSIFIMVFGVLNLITAVIVDTAAQARESDIMKMGELKEMERKYAWESFTGMCISLDTDESGHIDIDEIKNGVDNIPELEAWLSVMGVEEDDLDMVFEILDMDGDGKVTHEEFAYQLYKMKTQQVTTGICFVKHYIQGIHKKLKKISKQLKASDTSRPSSRPSDTGTTATVTGNNTTKKSKETTPESAVAVQSKNELPETPPDESASPIPALLLPSVQSLSVQSVEVQTILSGPNVESTNSTQSIQSVSSQLGTRLPDVLVPSEVGQPECRQVPADEVRVELLVPTSESSNKTKAWCCSAKHADEAPTEYHDPKAVEEVRLRQLSALDPHHADNPAANDPGSSTNVYPYGVLQGSQNFSQHSTGQK